VDINLSTLVNIILSEVNEANKAYSMQVNAKLVSIELENKGSMMESLIGLKDTFKYGSSVRFTELGVYKIVYEIVNESNQVLKITYDKLKVVDTKAPSLDILVDGEVYNENVHIVKVGNNSSLTIAQLREDYLTRVTFSSKDNHTLEDKLIYSGPSCSGATIKDEGILARYDCTFTVKDESGNTTSKTITLEIVDDIKPIIEGIEDKTLYVNDKSVSLDSIVCSDNNKNLGCKVYYKLDGGAEKEYTGNPISLNGGNKEYTIQIYAKDGAKNISELYTYTYYLDTVDPTLDIILTKEDVSDYSICGVVGNEESCVIDNVSAGFILDKSGYTQVHIEGKDQNLLGTTIYRHNGVNYELLSNTLTNISETGLYKVEISDLSGNTISKEFYIHKEDYVENSEAKKVDVKVTSGDTSEKVVLEYREIYLVEYNSSRETIKKNDAVFSKIKKTDGVYVIGINENQEYVNLIKYNGSDLYNTVTDIKANAVGVRDALIEIEGKYYLMMVMSDINEELGDEQEEVTKGPQKSDNGGSSFTWVFYVLGVIGVLGGGFLIMKLRKKVRAA